MLRPIKKVEGSGALQATQNMICHFARWLCAPHVTSADLTENGLEALGMMQQEANWLWGYLQGEHKSVKHLERAKHLADLTAPQKKKLRKWIDDSTSIKLYFDLAPSRNSLPLYSPFEGDPKEKTHWENLQHLMEGFYNKGLKGGLAYRPDGSPAEDKKQALNYETFRANFIKHHRIDDHEFARDTCVICDGELRNPSIDHWIAKAEYPLLSVCADNLIPICGECNQSPNKGTSKVHTEGSFEDWFHPHLRHPDGTLRVEHFPLGFGVTLRSTCEQDARRVSNLNALFNLEKRWTREFKAEYRKLFNQILTRQRKSQHPLTLESLCRQLAEWANGLNPTQPRYEVHKALAASLNDADRLLTWYSDLNDAQAMQNS